MRHKLFKKTLIKQCNSYRRCIWHYMTAIFLNIRFITRKERNRMIYYDSLIDENNLLATIVLREISTCLYDNKCASSNVQTDDTAVKRLDCESVFFFTQHHRFNPFKLAIYVTLVSSCYHNDDAVQTQRLNFVCCVAWNR